MLHEVQWASSSVPQPQWILAQTDQIIRAPLNPFRYWLRSYFTQSPKQTEAENKRAFNHKLNVLIADTTDEMIRETPEQGRSFLGALVNLYWEDSRYAQLDAQGRHEWTFTTLKELIKAESLRRPVLLNLEDIDQLDNESIAFIERLTQ